MSIEKFLSSYGMLLNVFEEIVFSFHDLFSINDWPVLSIDPINFSNYKLKLLFWRQ